MVQWASKELQNDKSLQRLPETYKNLRLLWHGVVAYKRCKPALYAWLERAQIRLNAYGEGGAARKRDRAAFEADNAM